MAGVRIYLLTEEAEALSEAAGYAKAVAEYQDAETIGLDLGSMQALRSALDKLDRKLGDG
jgi:hypothetical protein